MTSVQRRQRFAGLLVGMCLFAGLFTTPVFALPAPEEMVPDSAILLVKTSPDEKALKFWEANIAPLVELGKNMMNTEKAADLNSGQAAFEALAGVTLPDFLKLFTWKGFVSIVDLEINENVPEIRSTLSMELTDGKKAEEILNRFLDKALKDGKSNIRKEKIAGVEVTFAGPKEKPEGVKGVPTEIGICVTGNHLFLGCQKGLAIVLENLTKPASKPLKGDANYQAAEKKCGAAPMIFGFFNFARIAELAKKTIPNPQAIGVLEDLGLFDIKSMSSSFNLTGDDFLETHFVLDATRTDRGLFRIVDAKDTAILPTLVPDDVAEFTVANIHLENLFDLIDRALVKNAPDKYPFFAAGLAMVPGVIGSTLPDLLKSIGPGITAFTSYQKPYNLKSERKCVLIQVQNQQKIQDVMQAIMDNPKIKDNVKIDKEEYLGNTLFKINLPNMAAEAEEKDREKAKKLFGADLVNPGFCLLKDQLAIANDIDVLKDVLRRKGGSGASTLTARKEFQLFQSKIPGSINQLTFVDIQRVVDFFTSLAKNKELIEAINIPPPVKKFLLDGSLEKILPLLNRVPWSGRAVVVTPTSIEMHGVTPVTDVK